jgi:flagellar FliJ protein
VKHFQFKLATVLKVKKRVEEERQRQLQRAEMLRQTARQQLSQCQGALADAMHQYQCRLQECFDRYLAEDYQQYVSWLQQKLKTATTHLQQCETEVVRSRQCLIVATQERKVLDKLQERSYRQYQQEELQTEIDFLDELGTGRFIRRGADLVREDR